MLRVQPHTPSPLSRDRNRMEGARKPMGPGGRCLLRRSPFLTPWRFRIERTGIHTDSPWVTREVGADGWGWLGGNFRSRAGTR